VRKIVDHRNPELSFNRPCVQLGLPSSRLNHRPVRMRQSTLRIMARIDGPYLDDPCSGSLDTDFCLEALEMALSSGIKPQIIYYDQGSKFSSTDFVGRLQNNEIRISRSGRRHCYDNILGRGYGERSNSTRCICVLTAMAGRLKSTWPASCGGTAM
jgi:hypothetical protein